MIKFLVNFLNWKILVAIFMDVPSTLISKISFEKLSQRYQLIIDAIKDDFIKKLYSKYKFEYLIIPISNNRSNDDNQNYKKYTSFLIDYLKEYKFIVYNLIYQINSDVFDAVFCVEKECIIIENINSSSFNKIISSLTENNISLINVSTDTPNIEITNDLRNINTEIDTLLGNKVKIIEKNKFLKNTIRSISCFSNSEVFLPY